MTIRGNDLTVVQDKKPQLLRWLFIIANAVDFGCGNYKRRVRKNLLLQSQNISVFLMICYSVFKQALRFVPSILKQ